MIELTTKQKTHLRGLAQRLDAATSVGKAGLTDAVTATVSRLLDRHELVKIHIPAGPNEERQDTAQTLAQATNAALVAVVGRMVVLYRPNEQLPAEKRLELD